MQKAIISFALIVEQRYALIQKYSQTLQWTMRKRFTAKTATMILLHQEK